MTSKDWHASCDISGMANEGNGRGDWHAFCDTAKVETNKTRKAMIDTKELAWEEMGHRAYEVEMALREQMEREYDPYWEAIVYSLVNEQTKKEGENE